MVWFGVVPGLGSLGSGSDDKLRSLVEFSPGFVPVIGSNYYTKYK